MSALCRPINLTEVNPPVLVTGQSPEKPCLSLHEKSPSIDATPRPAVVSSGLQEKKTAFTLTPDQVAASDYHTLKGLPWEDQKLLVSLMPWDRAASLALHLKSHADESGSENLLILCNLRLEKLGVGPLPDGWKTSDRIPTLSGYSPTSFPPFSSFDMVEVPFFPKSLADVKTMAEKLTALKTSSNIPEGPSRLLLRFDPRYVTIDHSLYKVAKITGA
ncbi:hypothetical protein COOONC_00727 [Cooperia oncophora]